jgi:tetratricopeptide (TPR) repeat protein
MTQAYRFCDQMLGRLLELAGHDVHVMLFSDHGIRSGVDRPPGQSTGRGDTTWHTPLGLLAMHGSGIQADQWVWGGSLLDICPTMYYLLGLSAEELDGKPLMHAFEKPQSQILELCTDTTVKSAPILPIDDNEAASLIRWLLDDGYLHEENLESPQAAVIAEDACDFNLAQSHLQFGEIAEALVLFLACHRRRPNVPRFAIAAARCHAGLGDLVAARILVEQALARGIPSWLGDRLIGQLLTVEGEHDLALERLLSSESKRPMQRGVNSEIGAVYVRLGQKNEARRAFNKELLIDASEASALQGLGKLSLEDHDYDQALEYLLASASLQEVSPETHYLLARTLQALERHVDALRAVERALRQAPSSDRAEELRQELIIATQ